MKKITIRQGKRGIRKLDSYSFQSFMLDVFSEWDVTLVFPEDGEVEVYYDGDLDLKEIQESIYRQMQRLDIPNIESVAKDGFIIELFSIFNEEGVEVDSFFLLFNFNE